MAEEAKAGGTNILGVLFKVVLGLVFLALGILCTIRWWPWLWIIIKGCIGPFMILAGIITLAIAKE